MVNHPIGVLDSGVGGLTVWREIIRELPHESTIYIGDSKNTPYGSRPTEEIIELASKMIKFLLEQDVKLIVVACNTITVSGVDKLRKFFPQVPIIGTVPVIKTAVGATKTNTIGVLSTTKTAQSEYQKSLLKEYSDGKHAINLGTDRLVPLIEKGELNDALFKTLKEELEPFRKAHVDVLALGCTHFPFLKKEMQKILGKNVMLLDSGAAIARQVRKVLEQNKMLARKTKGEHLLYTTGDRNIFTRIVHERVLPIISTKSEIQILSKPE